MMRCFQHQERASWLFVGVVCGRSQLSSTKPPALLKAAVRPFSSNHASSLPLPSELFCLVRCCCQPSPFHLARRCSATVGQAPCPAPERCAFTHLQKLLPAVSWRERSCVVVVEARSFAHTNKGFEIEGRCPGWRGFEGLCLAD